MKHTRYPLTLPQFNIHSQEMAFPGTDVNVLYFVILIEDSLHENEMHQAIEKFVNRNMAVRTRIGMAENPVQYFVEEDAINVPVVDLSNTDEAKREQIYEAWGQDPFTYLDSPLWEFKMIKLHQQKCGLFCKFHHIWCDGWSTGLIWSGILSEYCRLKAGKHDAEQETLNQQNNFISYLKESPKYLKSDDFTNSRQFFLEYLKGVEPWSHSAPESKNMGRGTKEAESDHKARRSPPFLVPQKLSQELHEFCKQWKLTPYTVFMGALAVFEAGISGKDEVVLGMARLNRDTEVDREMVGEFVVQLPLRVQCTPESEFVELCQNILTDSRTVAVHKKYAMTHIINDLRLEEGVRGQLIRHSLSFQREKIELDGYVLPLKMWFGSPSVCVEDAIIHVVDLIENGYQVFYDYCTAYYQEDTILNMHKSLLEIIRIGIKQSAKVWELPLVGAEERKALWMPKNETFCLLEERKTILTMLRDAVAKKTDQLAVAATDGSYSFAQTWQLSDYVGACLQHIGIKKEETIGVFLPRVGAAIFSLLGIMKAGGTFVLLDQSYPQKRLQSIIKDSEMKYVITDKMGAEMLCGMLPVILYDEIPKTAFQEISIDSSQRCYMIYTSGSTGEPKGVQIEHGAIYNLLQPLHTDIVEDAINHGKTAVAIGAFSFDIFLFELFTNLMNGISVVLASEEELENPLALAALMERHQVDILYGTPSRLLSYCEMEVFYKALSHIKVMLSAGEAFPAALFHKVQQINPRVHIYNGYGPTEAAIGTSFQRVKGENVTLGKPVTNYKLRCMDKLGRLVPYGAIGELYIGGMGLARGYTKEAFNEPSFVEIEGERFYKSGDLVCRRTDDELVFAGRRDKQVKVRGFRIELDEIEAVLRSFKALINVEVLVKEKGNTEYLCAFYTAEYKVEEEELREFLSAHLPYYMIPSVYQQLAQMPMTINGKADIKALAEMELKYQPSYQAPETELQKKLTAIVEKVLGVEKVGIDDNFFDIGGDSLSAAQYAVEVLAQGVKFNYSEVFRYPTVRQFSEYLTEQTQNGNSDDEAETFDYTKIDRLLKNQETKEQSMRPMKHVLLTGATGYLGIHVLYELLNHTDTVVHCLIRKKENKTPQKYLSGRYYYYFEEPLTDMLEERLRFYTGDVAEDDLCETLKDVTVDTVINCAADVAHYTYGKRMQRVNTDSLKGMVKLCQEKGAYLIHVSTISIGQFIAKAKDPQREQYSEDDFYIEQDLSNQYIRSKFLAERIVLDAMEKGAVKGFIARVGNLQGRYSDGEFQINYNSNAFLTRLKSYVKLGFMPMSETEGEVDYSPIDYVAKAICLLAGYQNNQCIYHILNNVETKNTTFFEALRKQGHVLKALPEKEYEMKISELLASDNGRELLAGMAADLTSEMEGKRMLKITSQETAGILKKLGFKWPEIDENFLAVYVKGMEMLGFFDEEE